MVDVYSRSTAELDTASHGYQALPVIADVFAYGTIVELNSPWGLSAMIKCPVELDMRFSVVRL